MCKLFMKALNTFVKPVETYFLENTISRNTSRQFMKDKEITNVNFVANLMVIALCWLITLEAFMKRSKITFVIFVVLHLIDHLISINMSSQFMKKSNLTNVILVEKPSGKLHICEITKVQLIDTFMF